MQSWSLANVLQPHSLALLAVVIGLLVFLGVVSVGFKGYVQV